LPKSSLGKIKPLTFLLIIVVSTTLTLSFLPQAKAETTIISLTPSPGYVEAVVQLVANISTANGTYLIQFDEENVTEGVATENNVNASFNVPHAPEGVHNVTIVDVTAAENYTVTFTVLTSYSFEPILPDLPTLLQQGANVTVSINMTGGQSNYTYPVVEVRDPSGTKYEVLKNITTTVAGDFYDNFTYPNDCSNGANTNFTGYYRINFNATNVGEFFIGLTNSSQYHRGDVVNVKAVDYYPPSENVTLTVKFEEEIIDTVNSSAIDGIVDINWAVPLDATIGNYNISVAPIPESKKNASDIQIFQVPGFKADITTLNLADRPVSSVFVRTYDLSSKIYYNATSQANGSAILWLEPGNHSCEAFLKDVKVGEINITVEKEEQVDFTCQLTTLNINVIDAQNTSIPQVAINVSYNYTTNLGGQENKTGQDYGETNITGILQLYSSLPNVTYMINASRYGEIFNQDNNTLYNLPATPYFNATIFCPARTLQVNVTDGKNQPISDVAVKVHEHMGGLQYIEQTGTGGTTVLSCTFGRYSIRVYLNEILLNETTVDLFENQNLSIICNLYGLDVSISIVDYFGQPISNVNVTLQREGLTALSDQTQSDGKATFNNIVGGDLQIAVYLLGQTQPYTTNSFLVDSSEMIQIKIERYVMLVGFFVETSQFTTAIIIVVTVILILMIEVYGKRRSRPEKSES